MRLPSRSVGCRSSGKASFIAVVSGVVLAVGLSLVLVKFVRERWGKTEAGKAPADSGFSAAGQAAEERNVEAARQKYRRELRFCEVLRRFEGADLACLSDFAAEHKDLFFCGEMPAESRADCFRRVGSSLAADAPPVRPREGM